jgi:hypothetical protein
LVVGRGGTDDRERPSTKRATQATSEHNFITSLSLGSDDNAYGVSGDAVPLLFFFLLGRGFDRTSVGPGLVVRQGKVGIVVFADADAGGVLVQLRLRSVVLFLKAGPRLVGWVAFGWWMPLCLGGKAANLCSSRGRVWASGARQSR